MKVRKKPVEVEAKQLLRNNYADVFNWICSTNTRSTVIYNLAGTGEPSLVVQTLEGDMTAREGDWIIKGVNGEFYPCKPDIFEQTYDILS